MASRKPRRRSRRPAQSIAALTDMMSQHREIHRLEAEQWLDEVARLEDHFDRYLLLFAEAPVGYLTLDERGIVRDVNTAAAALLGTHREHLAGRPLLPFVLREDAKIFLRHLLRCARSNSGESIATDVRLRSTGDGPRQVRLLSRRGLLMHSTSSDYYTVMWDISEQRRRDHALRGSEKLHREIVEGANEAICIVNDRNEIVFANRRMGVMVGTEAEDLIGRSVFDLTPQSDLETARRAFEQRQAGAGGQSEQRLLRKDGSVLPTSVSTAIMHDELGRFSGMVRMYTDATERHALARVRETLVRQLVGAQERERERIARELHDQLGQHVVALALGLARLRRDSSDKGALARIDELRQVADQIGQDVHRLAIELRPAALDHLGVGVALTAYAEKVAERSGLDIDIHCDRLETVQLSQAVQIGLYRIGQEALTNVVKHARARHVSVILEGRDDYVQLIVEDDGVGLPTVRNGLGRLGVAGMQERAALLGGSVTVESSPGHGVTVFARIPYAGTTYDEERQDTPAAAR